MRVLFRIAAEDFITSMMFERWMKEEGIKFVMRMIVQPDLSGRLHWVVNQDDYTDKIVWSDWLDSRDKWFVITACNKQYVTECRWADNPKYLGSMCSVDKDNAEQHAEDGGWFLYNDDEDDDVENPVGKQYWIAADRNPNKCVPFTSHGLNEAMERGRWPTDPKCPQPGLAEVAVAAE